MRALVRPLRRARWPVGIALAALAGGLAAELLHPGELVEDGVLLVIVAALVLLAARLPALLTDRDE